MTLAELHASMVGTCSKHDQVLVLIEGCLIEGINTGTQIVNALASLGLNRQHVGMLLTEQTGKDPKRHRWSRDDAGSYKLLA